ncbi:hypothetical protein PCANC_06559 [Puccinia coronata f. sp. avenae]|uniref:Uncharacterized protein n=1 Tax=Puccinia coronata f. sp. avenae TaxID=200324 RepID=A0A2N5VA63_9BASI|nr:hypothetical protein PCANC_06559 [Puccinia coronata f. sp. avenae]
MLRSDSACPTTGQTRLFEHRSNCRVRPVNAGSADLCATGLSDPASHRSAAGGYPPVGYSLSSDALERLCRAREPQSDAQKLGQDGPLNLQPSGSPRPREIHGHSHTSSGRVHDYLKHPSGPVSSRRLKK